jgi:ADP-ribose pyrophosphatase YjhB (NUDIX family)
MTVPQLVAANGRKFATLPAAVFVFIIEPTTQRFLLLSSPAKRGRPGWEVVNGAVEANETLAQAAMREVAEETGPAVRVDLLGAVDAWTWRYDELVTHMISVAFVAAYFAGDVVPGDDMAGCESRWASLDEVRELAAHGSALIPESLATFEHALQCLKTRAG